MARYDKSRTKRPKQNAAVAPARPPRLDRAVDRGHDVLPAAAAPREVDVRAARGRSGPRLRPASASARAASGSATSSAGRAAPARSPSPTRRTRPEDPDGRRGVARPRDRARDRGRARGGDRRARHRRPARPEGSRRRSVSSPASASRSRPSASRTRSCCRRSRLYRAPSQLFPGFLGTGGQPVMQDQIASAVAGSRHRAGHGRAPGRGHERGAGRRRLQAARRAPARTTRTSSSSSRRRPSRPATRRPRSPRTSAFLKLAPDDPSATIVQRAAEAAQQVRSPTARWIDSLAREARLTSFPPDGVREPSR